MTTELVPVDQGDDWRPSAAHYTAAFLATITVDNTSMAYRRDLHSWLTWCAGSGVNPFTARYVHAQLWLAALADKGEADGTRARRIAAVSSWYKWLLREELVQRNPADLDSKQRPHGREPGTFGISLSVQQSDALLAAADRHSARVSALVALMYWTGARISELVHANVDAIGQDQGQSIITLRGKGGKERVELLPPGAYQRVRRYLDERATGGGDLVPNRLPAVAAGSKAPAPLFVTKTGRRADRAGLSRILNSVATGAGIVDQISPHDMRRTFATQSLDAGVPLADVQNAMGHANPSTTLSYDRRRNNLARSPARMLSPGPDLPEAENVS